MNIKTVLIAFIGITLLNCNNDNKEDSEMDMLVSDFSLTYPANNEANIIPGFQFQWEHSSNATTYELHIGEDAQANDIILTDLTGTSKIVENLRYGTTYFWKIVAFNQQGNSLSSPTFRFETKKNYYVLNANFYMPQLDRSRKVSIYLPPNYDNESISYPVLYMHDGQAIFDTNDYPYEEWEVDNTLDRLYQEIGFNLIVVGIDYNPGAERLTEYSPWVNTGKIPEWASWSTGLGGLGDEYMAFIVETLKPHIDSNYRTLSNKDNTGIMGSSMGGLISCYAGLQYPDVFGKIGVYSPSFWFSEGGIYELANTNSSLLGNSKFYFLAGGAETTIIDLSDDIQRVIDIFTQNGVSKNNLMKNIVPDGRHEEYLWREGFEETIKWLFIN